MKLIEIEKPTRNQDQKLEQGKMDFDKMIENLKPYLKKKSTIIHKSEVEWNYSD